MLASSKILRTFAPMSNESWMRGECESLLPLPEQSLDSNYQGFAHLYNSSNLVITFV